MSDQHAERVIDRYIGQPDRLTEVKSDVQHVLEYRRLNADGWANLIRKVGPDRVRAYHDHMERKARELGL